MGKKNLFIFVEKNSINFNFVNFWTSLSNLGRKSEEGEVGFSKQMETYEKFVQDLGILLEEYTEIVSKDEALLKQLQRLEHTLEKVKVEPERQQVVRILVMDILFFLCIIPSSILHAEGKHDSSFTYSGEVSRHTIHPITLEVAPEALKALALGLESGAGWQAFRQCQFFTVFEFERYLEMNMEQRIVALAMCSFAPKVSKRCASDALCVRMQKSQRLKNWLLVCSDTDEQYWINTCEGGAKNHLKIQRLPTVAHLLVFSDIILEDFKNKKIHLFSERKKWTQSLRIWQWTLPTERSYVSGILKSFEEGSKEIRQKGKKSKFPFFFFCFSKIFP